MTTVVWGERALLEHTIDDQAPTLKPIAPEAPPLCRETQSLGQQMLNATVGINGLMLCFLGQTIASIQMRNKINQNICI